MPGWAIALLILLPIVCLIGGFIIGYFVMKSIFTKQMRENPPITREQIKTMYKQMGRTPSEQQIETIMAGFKKQLDKK